MFEKIELLHGALRFSPFWIGVDLLLIAHFFFAWRLSWKKSGWKLDFWWLTLFLQFFVFILLMYPFNASVFNSGALYGEHSKVEPFVDKAFAVSVAGYLSLWLGRYLYDGPLKRVVSPTLKRGVLTFERVIQENITSKLSSYSIALLTIFLFLLIAPFFFSAGFAFSARDYFIEASSLRPLFNLMLCGFTVSLWYLAVRYEQWRRRKELLLLLFLFLLSLFLGSRWLILSNILFVFSYRIFANRGRVALWKMALFLPLLLCAAILFASVRAGAGGALHLFTKFWGQIFYGSHFSDTRDFAWMLSYWDGELLYGKTYVAAFLSFLPRFASEFREAWSYGSYSLSLTELDTAIHAGLRSGPFGEPYLNFGMGGVLLIGTIGGYALRMADVRMKEAIANHGNIIKAYASTFIYFLVSNFFNTSGFWLLYFFIFVNLALSIFGAQRLKSKIGNASP